MRLDIVHDFPFPVEELERLMMHPGLPDLLVAQVPLLVAVQIRALSRDGNRIERRLSYKPKPVIQYVGTKKVEPEWMEWIEESTFDLSTHRGSFKNVPVKRRIAEVFDNHGTLRIESTPNGCKRTILTELNIKLFVVGKLAERLIAPHAKELLDAEAALLVKAYREKLL
jgi:hypothetical protein